MARIFIPLPPDMEIHGFSKDNDSIFHIYVSLPEIPLSGLFKRLKRIGVQTFDLSQAIPG